MQLAIEKGNEPGNNCSTRRASSPQLTLEGPEVSSGYGPQAETRPWRRRPWRPRRGASAARGRSSRRGPGAAASAFAARSRFSENSLMALTRSMGSLCGSAWMQITDASRVDVMLGFARGICRRSVPSKSDLSDCCNWRPEFAKNVQGCDNFAKKNWTFITI